MFYIKKIITIFGRLKKSALILLGLLLLILVAYFSFIFLPIPFIRDLRNLYIETAMTTSHHQYLAKWFIPNNIIDEVMDSRISTTSLISKPLNKYQNAYTEESNGALYENENLFSTNSNVGNEVISNSSPGDASNTKKTLKNVLLKDNWTNDILNIKKYKVGDLDSHGNKIIINDIDNGIQVVEISDIGFKAYLALIEDPKQVYVGYAKDATYKGYTLQEFLTKEDAICGINASGFDDPNGLGLGYESAGRTYSRGYEYSRYVEKYNTYGFDEDDNFVVGHFADWDEKKLRDAIQFNPALIIDGEDLTIGKTGWGLHPRTCIGQCANGVVAFLTIDGRSAKSFLGGSIGKAAKILLDYGVVNAANCDGGDSTIMVYDGNIINEVSYKHKKGRYLPNAFLVKKRENMLKEEKEDIIREVELIQGIKYNIKETKIDLTNKTIADYEKFITDIQLFPRLEYLDLTNTNLTNWQCSHIRSLLKKKTKVVWTVRIADYSIRTDALTFSVNWTGNEKNVNRITSMDAELFQFCTNLVALDLGHQLLTDISFIPKYLPNLRVLILAGNNIKDISPLSSMTKLHYLEIHTTSDTLDMESLSKIQSLVDLLIYYKGNVSNVEALTNFPKIERLFILLAQTNPGAVQMLIDAYPGRQVVFEFKDPQDYGWRTHRRYKVVRDMFDNNYISQEITMYD